MVRALDKADAMLTVSSALGSHLPFYVSTRKTAADLDPSSYRSAVHMSLTWKKTQYMTGMRINCDCRN